MMATNKTASHANEPAPRPAPKKRTGKRAAAAGQPPSDAADRAALGLTETPTADLATRLVVREDESPWTTAELKQVRGDLEVEVARLQEEIELAESELVDLMRDSGDGAGDDQADAGAKTFEREQEITLANNSRDMLMQNLHALERLEDGTYGVCENCGNPIGKLRLQAAPRATLCMTCKTKQERR